MPTLTLVSCKYWPIPRWTTSNYCMLLSCFDGYFLQQLSIGGGGEGSEDGDGPNTAHAVLSEGSLECLALGKRGLFAAGKVRV